MPTATRLLKKTMLPTIVRKMWAKREEGEARRWLRKGRREKTGGSAELQWGLGRTPHCPHTTSRGMRRRGMVDGV